MYVPIELALLTKFRYSWSANTAKLQNEVKNSNCLFFQDGSEFVQLNQYKLEGAIGQVRDWFDCSLAHGNKQSMP